MSKRFILISLLLILISACTPQVTTPPPEEVQSTRSMPSSTVASTPPTITASPVLAATGDAIPHPTLTATPAAVDTATAAFSACPGAPGPYAAIGNQVTVVAKDVDRLKLRSEPKLSSDTVIGELNQFTQLQIVGGPICVREAGASYWFWQVAVLPDGEIGWVAEGDAQHSFLLVSVGKQYLPSTATAHTATTPSACPGAHAPFVAGLQVTVMAGNSDKLKLRSEPNLSPDAVIRELDQFTKLQIVGGPRCITSAETGISYWLWKVKVISGGKIGWVAEGDGLNSFLEPNWPP